jgi:hypothetical protein
VGSEEGCSSSRFGRGGDARVVAACMRGGGGGARSGFRGMTKGEWLVGQARLSVRGGGGVG